MTAKDPLAERLVCREHCAYYKPGTEKESVCRGFAALEGLIERHPDITSHFPSGKDIALRDRYPNLLRHTLCQYCDFFIDGCDFTDPEYTEKALPCGGYIAAALLLEQSGAHSKPLLDALIPRKAQVVLSPKCALKHLELPYVYDIGKDDLFEVDQAGFAFLRTCDGRHFLSNLPVDKDFLEFCLEEGLLITGPHTDERDFILRPSPVPSLRYLELQLTRRCNLRCRHCYLGEPTKVDLPLSQALSVLEEFEHMQGLRVLFSGGEPLLYPELPALSDNLHRFEIRKVLLTNGTLITEANRSLWCHFDEIQFSLDGLKDGHETLRGSGTFDQVARGIERARKGGIPVSIATMVHSNNLREFEDLAKWIEKLEVVEWNIDVPCQAGRLSESPEFLVDPREGAPFLEYATGGSYHGSGESFACGHHLCTVTAEGGVLKCGFFQDPLGSLEDGLETSWKRSKHIALSNLECGPCSHLSDCKGGCRFRATSPLGKDPVMCALYGVENQERG